MKDSQSNIAYLPLSTWAVFKQYWLVNIKHTQYAVGKDEKQPQVWFLTHSHYLLLTLKNLIWKSCTVERSTYRYESHRIRILYENCKCMYVPLNQRSQIHTHCRFCSKSDQWKLLGLGFEPMDFLSLRPRLTIPG